MRAILSNLRLDCRDYLSEYFEVIANPRITVLDDRQKDAHI